MELRRRSPPSSAEGNISQTTSTGRRCRTRSARARRFACASVSATTIAKASPTKRTLSHGEYLDAPASTERRGAVAVRHWHAAPSLIAADRFKIVRGEDAEHARRRPRRRHVDRFDHPMRDRRAQKSGARLADLVDEIVDIAAFATQKPAVFERAAPAG